VSGSFFSVNSSPNLQDLQTSHITGINDQAIEDVKKKSKQSQYRFAYPAIILYVFKILENIIFSRASEFPYDETREDPLEFMARKGIYSDIEIFGENLENQKEHQKTSLSFQYFTKSGNESKKKDNLESLEKDQIRFMDDQENFFKNIREIRNCYQHNSLYFEAYKKTYIDDPNLTKMKVLNKLENDDNKKVEEERAAVIMTILVAMILKFVPLEADFLKDKNRNSATVSFLNFLFITQIESENRTRLREQGFRKHIHGKIEDLFGALLEKIKKKLKCGEEEQSEEQKERCQMFNQILESIDRNRGLSWKKEKLAQKKTAKGGKSARK